MAMTRIIDMEVSVPRFDVGDDRTHTEPGRGAPAGDADRPAGYGMANYGRIFRARREGADHRPAAGLDDFMAMLGGLGVERALPFGVDNDEISALLRRYPCRILGLAHVEDLIGILLPDQESEGFLTGRLTHLVEVGRSDREDESFGVRDLERHQDVDVRTDIVPGLDLHPR